jgi:hypothetical protein
MSNIKLPNQQHLSEFIAFTGGLDIMSPPVTIPPGFAIDALNFEEDVFGGYTSVAGYERYDGTQAPSASPYAILTYSAIGTAAVGNTITGATSGATARVLLITASYMVIYPLTGSFVAEIIVSKGATVSGPAVLMGSTGKLDAIYLSLAADYRRTLIPAVPGSGNILGVWQYKDNVYAFRNAVTTGVGMYRASPTGWIAVNLGYEVYYSLGSGVQPIEGITIVQGAKNGVLSRITIEKGSFASGDAEGRLIFSSINGIFTPSTVFTSGIAANCVVQKTITIPNTSGRFDFINANFYGSSNYLRMYGCDGTNRAFEFDGTTFVPINTILPILGVTDPLDKPSYIAEHQHHLCIAIQSALFISSIGTPYSWQALTGAAEIDMSDKVTGLMKQPGENATPALAVYCRNRTYILYGTTSATWNLSEYNSQSGAIPWSIQKIGTTYAFDDRGITTLATSMSYGNFEEATVSQRVQGWLKTKRAQVTDSHIVRDKQQYRLFFNDGSAAYWTIGKEIKSMMPVMLANPVLCSCSDEKYNTGMGGDELVFFGSSNGYVYQMDKGTSFDGASITSYLSLSFNNFKAYRLLKKFRHVSFEIKGSGYSEFKTNYDLGYGSVNISQPAALTNIVNLSAPYWDSPDTIWDKFVWDGVPLTALSMSTPGIGENISIKISTEGTYFSPIKFSGCFVEYSPQRQMR